MEIVIILMVLLASALFILPPLLQGDDAFPPMDETASREMQEATARRDAAVDALADLQSDHAAGKLSDEDYQRLRMLHQADALRALRDLEALGVPAAPTTEPEPSS